MTAPSATTNELRPSWRETLRAALMGSEQDFTQGSIGRAVVLLAIPMVLEMVMESLFGIVNVFWVARLGAGAVAIVGLTESMLTILFGIAMGMGMAATAVVARRVGEKDADGASRAAMQALLLGVVASVAFGLVGGVFGHELLTLMGAAPELLPEGGTYTRILLGGSGSILMLFLVNAIFRGAGDAAMAMRTLWISNGINIVLDPLLIFGLGPFPEMGVAGAAVATTIARSAGVAYALWQLGSGRRRVTVRLDALKPDREVMASLMRLSGSGMLQFLIATASWVGLVRIMAVFGSEAVAGYTIGVRILIFTLLPSWGMANAAATLVGQNLGAQQPDRAESSVWITCRYNMVFLGLVSIAYIFFPRPIVELFSTEPVVAATAAEFLRLVAFDYLLFACGMVIVQAFNGAGDTVTPAIINLCCYWLFQIPVAYLLALTAGLGPRGASLAVMVTEGLVAIVAIAVFRRGKWREQKV